jgi:hypothetical protein
MSTWIKAVSIILAIVTIGVIYPQKMEARHSGEAPNSERLAALQQSTLSLAAGLVNPTLGTAIGGANDAATAGEVPAAVMGNQSAASAQNENPPSQAISQNQSGLDLEALITASPESAKEGLRLVTRKNSAQIHPANHAELVNCVDKEAVREDGWAGAGIVGAINQNQNPYGEDSAFTASYEAFFYVEPADAGEWSFSTDSNGASEIEIDGKAVTGWYGGHASSGLWEHNGSIELSSGWHNLIGRYELIEGSANCQAAFRKPGEESWSSLDTLNLTLKPVNLDEGILLVTRKNNWSALPANQADMLKCVEQDSSNESGWYGASIVNEICQSSNIHAGTTAANDYFTAYYEAFFYADSSGSWSFAIDGDDASELAVDEQVVAAWYGAHTVANNWNHNGTIGLGVGWHHLVYRQVEKTGAQAARAAFKAPGNSDWQPLHSSRLRIKGVCWNGVDGDCLPDSAEAVLGTDPESRDTDGDQLDDWFEVKNNLDPLKPDSNEDGLNDYFEITDVSADVDGDGIPNASDDDNDNDGVRDNLDISPFALSSVNSQFQFNITTSGSPTYVDFQLRPQNVDHLKLPAQSWDWPDGDNQGTMQDLDKSKDDLRLVPMLEMTTAQTPAQEGMADYGIEVAETALELRGATPWSAVKKAGDLGYENAGGGSVLADLNGNGKMDMLLMGIDDPAGVNSFYYQIGWDLDSAGNPTAFTSMIAIPGLGNDNQGGGAAVADINGNGKPDLLLMGIDAPQGANEFRYKIGWDVKADGTATSWSPMIAVSGVGDENEGGGAAIADIDGNGQPDLVLMGIDAQTGPNQFRYKIGWNLQSNGTAASWSAVIYGPETANYTAGGGAGLADIDNNGVLDLVLTAIDNTGNGNVGLSVAGWNINQNGVASSWSPILESPDLNSGGWTRLPNDLNEGAGGNYIYLCVRNGISDQIKVISSGSSSPDPGSGWTRLPNDLNEGAGGKFIYLCIKDSLAGKIKVISGDSADITPGAGWHKINHDLNEGAGGAFIFLCTADSFSDQVAIISSDDPNRQPNQGICAGGAALGDIDANGKYDVLLMGIDNPETTNSFRYCIGWDLSAQSKLYVPLLPVDDNGKTVALSGRLFLPPSGTPETMIAKSRLVWMVNAQSDMTAESWTAGTKVDGVSYSNEGGGTAIADINGNGKPDLVLMGIDAPEGANEFRYKVGWDLRNDGTATSWSSPIHVAGPGDLNAGGGAAIADINGNGKPDLLLMAIDNPEGPNNFRYKIGWDLKNDGVASSWSTVFQVDAIGDLTEGGGAALADINGNGKLDLLLMGIDAPKGPNQFRYKIGWDLNSSGQAANWSSALAVEGVGDLAEGGDATIADINGDGKLDLVLMAVDSTTGLNQFRYKVGWGLGMDGQAANWSPPISQDGVSDLNEGGGAAIADINSDGKLDLLLMGIDATEGANQFRYKIAWNIEPENKTLAKYYEDFNLTGLNVEENFGCDAGLVYSNDLNQTTRSLAVLRYEFLNNSQSFSQAIAELPDFNITASSKVKHFTHSDAAAKEITGSMITAALADLDSASALPVLLATANTSATRGLDSLVATSYILGNSLTFDLTAEARTTFKSIKMAWYNTTTHQPLNDTELIKTVNSWNWSTEEKSNFLLLLMLWDAGETSITGINDYAVVLETPEKAEVLTIVADTPQLLNYLKTHFSFPLHTTIFSGASLPLILRMQKIYQGWRTWMRTPLSSMSRLRNAALYARQTSQFYSYVNPLRSFMRLPTYTRVYGSTIRFQTSQLYNTTSRFFRFARILGKVLVVASILAIVAEFLVIAGKEGWSGFGFAVAGMYAAMEIVYMAILIGIACIPLVGWAIDLVILLVDLISSCFGYGSGWVMEKIIDAFVDYDARSEVDLNSKDNWVHLDDYDNNGLTAKDEIKISSHIVERVWKTGDGSNRDVNESYNTPNLDYRIPDSSPSGVSRETFAMANNGSSRWVEHELSVWVKPDNAMVNYPLTVFFRTDFKVFYDKVFAATHSRESYSDTFAAVGSTMYFDILPNNLSDFLTWSAITAQDSDMDKLSDGVEKSASNDYYRIVNKQKALALDAGALEASVQVNPASSGTDQQWAFSADLANNAMALKTWNGNFAGTHASQILTTTNNYSAPEERFNLVYLGGDAVALKAANGLFVAASPADYPNQLAAVSAQIGEQEEFSLLRQSDETVVLRAWNGKYVSADPAAYPGQLATTADAIGSHEKLQMFSSGGYQIYARSNGGCISLVGGSSAEGTPLTTKTYYGRFDDQRWLFEPAGEGYYRISAPNSGKVLGISGTALSGATVVLESYNGSDDQLWKYTPVESRSSRSNADIDADGLPDGFEIRNIVDIGANGLAADTDQDGLPDRIELEYGTNPAAADTDGDGLSDLQEYRGWQVSFNYHGKTLTQKVWSDPLLIDSDNDGLSDYYEKAESLNPRSKDTDGDGILDPQENPSVGLILAEDSDLDSDQDGLSDALEKSGWTVTFKGPNGVQSIQVVSDPLLSDTDFDGLTDSVEYALKSNPQALDSDGDGLDDGQEQSLNTNLLDYDTDNDGVDDGIEVNSGSNPLVEDTDGDGLNDLQEQNRGTNPLKPDTDEDGLSDSQEVSYTTNPLLPDSDADLLFDSREISLGTDPNNPDSDGDGVKDGQEVMNGTDPLLSDSDADGISDGDELELWTDPLNKDTDGDGLSDFQELQYGTNPLSADSNNNGINDALDNDSYSPQAPEVYVLYDQGAGDYEQFIQGLSQYTQVITGTLAEIPDYQSKPYVVLLGYPAETSGTVSAITWDLLSKEPEIRERMLESDQNRFATGVNVWKNNKMVTMLSKPYHSDYFRVLASMKSLKYEITDNSVALTWPTARSLFFLEAIKEIDFYFEVNLINRVTPSVKITRGNNSSIAHPLTRSNGLDPQELAVGKYMDIQVSDNIQNDESQPALDNIDSAIFKIYYTAGELDRNGDGDCLDACDIDEKTLCLYRWNTATELWEKVDTLPWVIASGVATANLQPYDKQYEGYVWAQVDHFSLYALAGKVRSPISIPGFSWSGMVIMVLILGLAIFWFTRRRQIRRRIK